MSPPRGERTPAPTSGGDGRSTEPAVDLGVVIPALDEEEALPALLSDLRALPVPHQVLVVDGGSRDRTVEVAREMGARVVRTSPAGRGRQLAAGVRELATPWLLLLHADSRLPPASARAIGEWLEDPPAARAAHLRFRLGARGPIWRLIECGQRVRERLSGLAYGDQGLLVHRERLDEAGGIPELPIMEDVALVRSLRRTGGLERLDAELITSARRYRENGPLRTWVRNASLLLLHSLGVEPARLARWYPPRTSGVPKRTLLVFAKAPEPGRVKTRLARALGPAGAADLYRRMGRRVVDRLRGGRYEMVVCFDPPDGRDAVSGWLGPGGGIRLRPQVPGDLGARMEEAFGWAFGTGGPVVIVGTDVPDLDRGLVEAAFAALEEPGGPDLVLGPATDGGYYLLGLRRPAPALFRAVAWSTDRVLETTLDRARKEGLSWSLLDALADVDRPEDLPVVREGPVPHAPRGA